MDSLSALAARLRIQASAIEEDAERLTAQADRERQRATILHHEADRIEKELTK